MRRIYLLTALLSALSILTACASEQQPPSSSQTQKQSDSAVENVKKAAVIKSKSEKGPFSAELTVEPGEVKANQQVKLSFVIKDSSDKPIPELDIVHEKPMHLLAVSDDLAFFNHIHPHPGTDGKYAVETQFPSGGKYKLYLDYTPKGASQQISRLDVDVAGAPRVRAQLVADTLDTKTFGSLRVTLKPDKPLKSGEAILLNFKVADAQTGKPVTDLQPYLGALAHFVIISEDTTEFLHAHPMEVGQQMEASRQNDGDRKPREHAEPPKSGGPEVAAHTSFPKPGIYKVWAQFQRNGQVIIADFVVKVG